MFIHYGLYSLLEKGEWVQLRDTFPLADYALLKEDFKAPERGGNARVGQQFEVARRVYELNKDKPREICNTLQPHTWGYNKQYDGSHKTAEDILDMLADARSVDANLLLNVGPEGDGSFPQEDIRALLEAGERLRHLQEP